MIIIIIPAKGGSTRLPNKNMAVVNARPMLDYAIDQALASKRAAGVYVTTDSNAIDAHAQARGVKVIRRPKSLGGETPMLDVLRHAMKKIDNPDISVVVSVQPDHPDRTLTTDEAIDAFEAAGADLLHSTEADETKNGAHHILTVSYLETGKSEKTVYIVDDCTNVHYKEDLARAARRLRANT
jgi:CMP-N-acetylneuraminic acid synthetase